MELPESQIGPTDVIAYRECPRRMSYGMRRHVARGEQNQRARTSSACRCSSTRAADLLPLQARPALRAPRRARPLHPRRLQEPRHAKSERRSTATSSCGPTTSAHPRVLPRGRAPGAALRPAALRPGPDVEERRRSASRCASGSSRRPRHHRGRGLAARRPARAEEEPVVRVVPDHGVLPGDRRADSSSRCWRSRRSRRPRRQGRKTVVNLDESLMPEYVERLEDAVREAGHQDPRACSATR
jgi:hypothetical protein